MRACGVGDVVVLLAGGCAASLGDIDPRENVRVISKPTLLRLDGHSFS